MESAELSSERSLTLMKGLRVLQFVGARPFGCTITETSKGLMMSRAAARRLLLTLSDGAYLRQDGNWFLPTMRLAELSATPVTKRAFWDALLPPMRKVSERTGEACSMSALIGMDIEYVARSPARRVLSVHLDVGSRLPAAHTSMGRVLLSRLSEDAREVYLDGVELPRRTRHSISDPGILRDVLAHVASDGFAIVDQELEDDLISVAVPVLAPTGATLAALNFSSTPARYPSKRLREAIVPMLTAASHDITDLLRQVAQQSCKTLETMP